MFEHIQSVHLIGANGVGLSAIGKLFLSWGRKVSGSDLRGGMFSEELTKMGADIKLSHASEHVSDDVNLVLYSSAVPESNPERQVALERGLEIMSYAEFLGKLAENFTTIAVTGTHGKSTTTAMVGKVLEAVGLDPTVVVGTRVPGWELGNVRVGQVSPSTGSGNNLLVLEACEYKANHLFIKPNIGVITNVEMDHPDFYRDLNHVQELMDKFADGCEKVIWVEKESVPDIELKVPGMYNKKNAAGALAVARELELDETKVRETLENFTGVWRRYERLGEWHGAEVISDYGHHPTSIKETLEATRELFPDKRLIHVFQPHQHARTKELFDEFVEALGDADITIVAEIYGVAGRKESGTISSKVLVKAVNKSARSDHFVHYAKDLSAVENLLRENVKKDDVVLVQGAGDIDEVARKIV